MAELVGSRGRPGGRPGAHPPPVVAGIGRVPPAGPAGRRTGPGSGRADPPSRRGTGPRAWPSCWPTALGRPWPPLDDRRPRARRRCSSPPTACPCGRWPRATPTPTRWPSPPRTSPACSGLDDAARRRPGGWPGRARADRRPLDRPRPAGRDPTGGRPRAPPRWWSARSGSSPTISRSSTTSTSRRRRWPGRVGMAFARTPSLNDDPRFLDILAGVVHRTAAADRPGRGARGHPVRRHRRDPTAPADRRRRRWRHRRAGGGLGAGRRHRNGTDVAPPVVHVLEAGDRVGGKLGSAEFAGRDGRPGRRRLPGPAARGHRAVRRARAGRPAGPGGGQSGASMWARGRLRAMPDGLNLGVPTRWWPLARSGILGPAESLAGGQGPGRPPPRPPATSSATGRSGEIVGERLGRPVVERLVDPLIGGIHAGGVDDLSAAATLPVLIAASHQSGKPHAPARRVRPPSRPGPPGTDAAGPPRCSGPSPAARPAWPRSSTEALCGPGGDHPHRRGRSTPSSAAARPDGASAAGVSACTTRDAGPGPGVAPGATAVEPTAPGPGRRRRGAGRPGHRGRRAAGAPRTGGGRHPQHHRVRLGGGGHPLPSRRGRRGHR